MFPFGPVDLASVTQKDSNPEKASHSHDMLEKESGALAISLQRLNRLAS